jgi:hypothetical protein
MRRICCWFAAACLAWLVTGRTALAQYNLAPQATPLQRLQQLPVVDLKGTVEEVKSEWIGIKCDGQSFLLAIAPNYTRVQCNGTAERAYLKPGVLVRIAGDFDKKMQPKAPIDELYVVTPSESAQPGIHADEPTDGEQPRSKQRGNGGGGESWVIVGTIKLIKDDQLQIIADGKNVKVQLAEDAEIKVEVDDYSLATAGDEITVRGRTVQPPQDKQPGNVVGEEVTITLAQPLEASSKAPAKKKKSSKPVKRASR